MQNYGKIVLGFLRGYWGIPLDHPFVTLGGKRSVHFYGWTIKNWGFGFINRKENKDEQ